MRVLLLTLLAAACATTAAGPPNQRVAGCWIARGGEGVAVTMRWLADPQRPDVLIGDKLRYLNDGATTNERFTLEHRAEGWTLCNASAEGAPCWLVAEGEGGSLEGGRAFLDVQGSRLQMTVIDQAGVERILFDGRRDGCD